MSAISNITVSSIWTGQAITSTVYIVIGTPVVLLCFLTEATILCSKKLRRRPENVIIIPFIAGDLIHGLAHLGGGVRRMAIIISAQGSHTNPVTSFDCMCEFYTTLLVFGPQMVALMMLVICIDRFICIVDFELYIGLRTWYRYVMALVPVCLVTVSTTFAWVFALLGRNNLKLANVDPMCTTNTAVTPMYWNYQSYSCVILSISSSVLYGVLMIYFWVKRKDIRTESVRQIRCERELKITKLFALIQLSSFLLFAVPQILSTFYDYVPLCIRTYLLTICGCVRLSYSLVSICIYISLPNDVRKEWLVIASFFRQVKWRAVARNWLQNSQCRSDEDAMNQRNSAEIRQIRNFFAATHQDNGHELQGGKTDSPTSSRKEQVSAKHNQSSNNGVNNGNNGKSLSASGSMSTRHNDRYGKRLTSLSVINNALVEK